jgi:hypothetical protein
MAAAVFAIICLPEVRFGGIYALLFVVATYACLVQIKLHE